MKAALMILAALSLSACYSAYSLDEPRAILKNTALYTLGLLCALAVLILVVYHLSGL